MPKPTAITEDDWRMLELLDVAVGEAIASGDIKRVSMLYSKIRYPMCSLVEFEQKWECCDREAR